jgi:hypothetical protein
MSNSIVRYDVSEAIAAASRTPTPNGPAVCLTVKPVEDPDALIGHARFDERCALQAR